MENYIVNTYDKVTVKIDMELVEILKRYKPKGCPFNHYTLWDLIQDFINGYSWKIYGIMSIADFVRLLKAENYLYAVIYGDDMIDIIEEYEKNSIMVTI